MPTTKRIDRSHGIYDGSREIPANDQTAKPVHQADTSKRVEPTTPCDSE